MTAKSIHQKRIFDSEDNLQSMYMWSSKVFSMAKCICIVSCMLISSTVLKWRTFAFGALLLLLLKMMWQTPKKYPSKNAFFTVKTTPINVHVKFKSVSHGQIHLYCKLRVNIFNRFEMAPFCFWRTFVFASKDGAADAATAYCIWCAKQAFFVL